MRRLDVGLVELDRALVLFDDIDLVFGLLLGDGILLRQQLIARQIDLRFRQHPLIVSQLRLLGIECCLVGPGIDQEQLLTLFDVLPGRKLDLNDRAVDLGLHGHAVDRLNGADVVHNVRDILTLCHSCRDRDRRWWFRRGGRPPEIVDRHAAYDRDKKDSAADVNSAAVGVQRVGNVHETAKRFSSGQVSRS